MEKQEEKKIKSHDIGESTTSILAESRTMVSIAGVIFGFLLTASLISQTLVQSDRILLLLTVLSSITSIGLFAMPVIYHHIQFPYRDRVKFVLRSHVFLLEGFIFFTITLLLSTLLILKHAFGPEYAPIAFVPFAILLALYWSRKIHIK